MNPLMLLKEMCLLTRMTNMVAYIGDQRVTRVSQRPFLALTWKIGRYNNHEHLFCFSNYKFAHEVPRGLHIL
jgi:sorbitol-specific phosphotransferase system component IIC